MKKLEEIRSRYNLDFTNKLLDRIANTFQPILDKEDKDTANTHPKNDKNKVKVIIVNILKA
ncbi:MAG: hypothetical protein QXU98_14120 [Candidatus Parvarchaeota archaeon]